MYYMGGFRKKVLISKTEMLYLVVIKQVGYHRQQI